ncbi:DNA primase [Mycobacterium phage Indlulamithi]|uniref:DNA primase/polymerase n=1 Tax=Mycobacterium phage Indlulamithi TaxID=2656582 RepID=A0A649VEC5_9CAUD|nr:DNA primase [Mycobacterium phage Indlulamithi]QGJ90133.1 DNA primase/polymerase [Mycobacterium phage Indlulamithi]
MALNQPRSINSTRPFHATAREYVQKGWGVLPLPERRKEYPPVGFTGRAGRFATEDDLNEWLNPNGAYVKGNIAIRVGNVIDLKGVRHEVIGIDVDAHSGKRGARDLARLEKKCGKLPATWTSSSRTDGVSGIRFYLVPYGFGFRGQASDCIDIVQRVHRYAVVYPSWHPETKAQYFWYPPGESPDGQGFSTDIPKAATLPLLPDAWIDELTANRQQDTDGQYGIDLDSTPDELKAWRAKVFNPDIPDEVGGMCPLMRKAVERHIEKIESSPSNHDKITRAHHSLLNLAAEGHSGISNAIQEVEAVWLKDIKAKAKRPEHMVKREITRSYWGALRKLKAKADGFKELGLQLFSAECCILDKDWQKPPSPAGKDDRHWIDTIPFDKSVPPREFDCNDVSQAHHFHDRVGDNVRYLNDYNAWLLYDGNTWHIDDFTLVRDLFDRCCVRPSRGQAFKLQKKLAEHMTQGGSDSDNIGAPLKRDAAKLFKVSDTYRNDPKIKAMLNCMKSIPGVAMRYSELNWDATILAMPDGNCLKLDEPKSKPDPKAKGFTVVENEKQFYTTMATKVEYRQDISRREIQLWSDYLDLFLPDADYRRFVQKALGYILIGGNPEKLALFLVGQSNTGKSTMLQAIQGVLNDYGATFQPSAVFKDAGSGLNPELGNLLHKRGIFSSESGSQRIYANPLKRNTGGDKISVTRKYANDQIVGIPQFTPVVATNQPPTIDDADEALVKRILVLPFTTRVPENQNDKRADVTLARDAKHAIFNWLVHGYKRYVREGLSHDTWHPWSIAATLEFASELSDVATFLSETCTAADDSLKQFLTSDVVTPEHEAAVKEWSKVSVNGLYMAYQRECAESGQTPMATRLFSKKVRQVFGVTTIPVRREGKVAKHYLGIKYQNEASNQITT